MLMVLQNVGLVIGIFVNIKSKRKKIACFQEEMCHLPPSIGFQNCKFHKVKEKTLNSLIKQHNYTEGKRLNTEICAFFLNIVNAK